MIILKQSMVLEYITPNALELIERAGRTCYKSEDRMTKDSAVKFVEMIKSYEHESVLEHASATFRMITDRGVTHEIVRHRIASYSQESTRYCNYTKEKFEHQVRFILPVWFYDFYDKYGGIPGYENCPPGATEHKDEDAYNNWASSCNTIEYYYNQAIELGQSPQQARAVLTNSLKTEIVMTANFREWLHFFKLRTSQKAHPQMRELALQGQQIMHQEVPALF
jgi:thymidylate synthase (FAD)